MKRKNLTYQKTVCGITICCNVIPMGSDYTICISDDHGGHVGSVVLSVSRPSLSGEGISCTSSVLNRMGHKDEEIARHVAEAVASHRNCAAVCTCGIHIDGIQPDQIQKILEACREIENWLMSEGLQ